MEINSDAVYMRNRLDEISGTSGTQKDKEKGKGAAPSKGGKGEVKKKTSNLLRTEGKEGNHSPSEQDRQKDEATENPMKGSNKNAFCLWDNCYGHSSYRCFNNKFDHAYKLRALAKNKACRHCLKIGKAGHEKECSNKRACLICGKFHNTNLHARKDILEALKKRKEKEQTDSARYNED